MADAATRNVRCEDSRSVGSAQRFLSPHAPIQNTFAGPAHLNSAEGTEPFAGRRSVRGAWSSQARIVSHSPSVT